MRLRLLGTGSADGWPNPWCSCASCAAAARQGVVRHQTSALVDDDLLIELGADGPRAALRAGVSLAGVSTVLVTHAHPDHHHAPAWDWRDRAPAAGPVTLLGPPAVVRSARSLGLTAVPVRAGDELAVGARTVRVLAAAHGPDGLGPPVLFDLTGADGSRLLWATDTGPLPEATLAACAGRDYDLVLLELTSSATPGHLDLDSWPEQLAALRRSGAVTARTRVGAVHLGHGNPPPDELDPVLAGWGAFAPRDGDELVLGTSGPGPAPVPSPRRVLVLGGARSGKSAYAERFVAAEPEVTYVATAPDRPGDEEWAGRCRAHVARRPRRWATLETPDAAGALRERPETLLVDDLGMWLTSQLDREGWPADPRSTRAAADDLVGAWRDRRGTAVLVAPDVGGGVVPGTAAGRSFRDLLGELTQRLARESDGVVQVVAGLPRWLR